MIPKTFADFFAGIGLARLGLNTAGWASRFANDLDAAKYEMYTGQFGESEDYVLKDVRRVSVSEVPDVTLWWSSFPCTDVSLAGYRKGLGGSETGALCVFLKLLDDKDGQRPSLVVLENVIGFLTSNEGEDFALTVAELNRLGYSCDSFVLDAKHFVPQSRPRLFVVGMYDAPVTDNVADALEGRDEHLKDRRLTSSMLAEGTVRWRILDIPSPPTGPVGLGRVIDAVPEESARWWSEDRVNYLLGQMSSKHRRVVEDLWSRQSVTYATAYRRMRAGKSMAEVRADGIAGCLRTPRGGSSRQILLAAGGGVVRVRYMTPREYARLMGADGFKLDAGVSDNQAYFGFGDAVCVPAVEWIAEHVINPLVRERYEAASEEMEVRG